MQKVILTLYLENKRKPLFQCEISDDAENTVKKLEDSLNDTKVEVIRFGQVCFKRSAFKYFEISYK